MLSYGVLGPLHVQRDGIELALQTPMLRRLLGLLLCHDGHAASADTLTAWLWGERPPATARKTLQNYVVRLRRVLGDPTAVRHDAEGYRLSFTDECVDLRLFQKDAAEGSQFSHTDPRRALWCYSRALDGWRGNAFEGLLDLAVIASYAHRLEEQRLHVLEQACEIRLDMGQHAEVAAALPQAIEQHPFRERLSELLMLALYKGGRQHEALREYQRVWETMTGELGIAPGSRLRLLQQQILRDDPALLWGNRPSPSGPGIRRAFLPRALPDFTGRAGELAFLDRVARGCGGASAAAVVTTAGLGGVGKTSLAVHWAHRSADRFPDGQLFLDLHRYGPARPLSPADALGRLLRAIGPSHEDIPSDVDEAAALYRARLADTRMLIVLDNACTSEQVRPLIPAGPGNMVMVTSRRRLSGLLVREGAHRLDLDPFSPAESLDLLRSVLGANRVNADHDAASRLAAACAHMPLALRIIGAELNANPHTTLAQHAATLAMGDRLTRLAITDEPSESMMVIFDRTFSALRAPARELFRLLGVVPLADFTPGAAAALANISEAESRTCLDDLANAYLVTRRSVDRYATYDFVREYATLRSPSKPDTHAAMKRLATWYLDALVTAQETAQAWLDDELPNIAACLQPFEDAGLHEDVWQLVALTRSYLRQRGGFERPLATASTGSASAMALDDLTARTVVHEMLGGAPMQTRPG